MPCGAATLSESSSAHLSLRSSADITSSLRLVVSGSDLVETSKALLNYERVEFAVTRGLSSDTILR